MCVERFNQRFPLKCTLDTTQLYMYNYLTLGEPSLMLSASTGHQLPYQGQGHQKQLITLDLD